jgi:putative acetyltransferase
MIVRPEKTCDIAEISVLVADAFSDHPYSNQTEHRLVDALRAAGGLTVSLVALDDAGKVAGHIAFSPVSVGGADAGWLIVAPLAVRRDLWRRGIGSELLKAGLGAARVAGAPGVVLVGDPAFYARFGFASGNGPTMTGVPAANLMALSFGAPVPAGEVVCHPAFAVCFQS